MTSTPGIVWPATDSAHVVLIADCTSHRETKLLREYVEGNPPPNGSYSMVFRSFRKDKRGLTKGDLKAILELNPDSYLIPLRLHWIPKATKEGSSVTLVDMMMGNTPNPNSLQQAVSGILGRQENRVVQGKGASLAQLKCDYEKYRSRGYDYKNLEAFIERSALLALEKAERDISGSRYRIPRMLDKEVLNRPAMQEALKKISDTSGRSIDHLVRYAKACLKEMAATPTPVGNDLAAALGRFMYTRGFDPDIDFADGDIERIRQLLKEKPVAFLFTHKSHIDGFLLIWLFHQYNLPPAHVFGGINMSLPGLGTLLRSSGAIFIRRSFGDDDVYKAVFKNYIDYLGEKRFPVMWALEGTRSRTGKLMPPRYGLINYVASAYARDDAQDLVLMPISICYDQVPEVADYDHLQAGGAKRPESASWFMEYLSGLKHPHGKIHVRFGEGVPLSRHLDKSAPKVDPRVVQKLAFDLAVDVNRATPITLNGLICYVLLENGHRAVNYKELAEGIQGLWSIANDLGFLLSSEAKQIDEASIRRNLAQLGETGVIKIINDGIESVYMIPHDSGRMAAYYRNGILHFFTTSAIAELALMAVRSEGQAGLDEFREEALRIRDILKYEFFFEGSEAFLESMEKEMDQRFPSWQKAVKKGQAEARAILTEIRPVIGHGTLRPFIEAYLLMARSLRMENTVATADKRALIDRALTLGKQRVLQQRIHCEESVSSNYFENAIKIAENLNLLEISADIQERRQQWLDELRQITANIRYLASLSEAKRISERNKLESVMAYT